MTAPPPRMVRALGRRDAYPSAMAVLLALVVIGFSMIGLGTRSVQKASTLALQTPGLVSGCVAGIGLERFDEFPGIL